MGTKKKAALIVGAVFLLSASLAWAHGHSREKTEFKRVVGLSVNDAPLLARFPFGWTSPLDRGFYYPNGRHLVYAVPVVPGQFYSLGLDFPALGQNVAVSLYDREPWVPGARWAHLPFPAVTAKSGPTECYWHFGISPHSSGSLVYVVVETSSPLDRGMNYLPHTIFINSPAVQPIGVLGQGTFYMEGPRSFQVVGGTTGVPLEGAVAAVEPELADSVQWIPPELKNRQLPGDLIQNSRFKQGLAHWEPSRGSGDSPTIMAAVTANGLRLWSNEGRGSVQVRQQLDEKVRDATALFLRAQVKVAKQVSPGLGSGREAPVAISVCYEDAEGVDHCGKEAFWQGFFILDPAKGKPAGDGQKVSPGVWYQYVMDLTQLEPRPAVIQSIAIEGSGWPEWEGWVKEVHLLKRTGKK